MATRTRRDGDAGRRHIRVVNDTEEILDLFREVPEDERCRVWLYSSAVRDLDEIKGAKPDLVILDFSSAARRTAGGCCAGRSWIGRR